MKSTVQLLTIKNWSKSRWNMCTIQVIYLFFRPTFFQKSSLSLSLSLWRLVVRIPLWACLYGTSHQQLLARMDPLYVDSDFPPIPFPSYLLSLLFTFPSYINFGGIKGLCIGMAWLPFQKWQYWYLPRDSLIICRKILSSKT